MFVFFSFHLKKYGNVQPLFLWIWKKLSRLWRLSELECEGWKESKGLVSDFVHTEIH